MFEFLEDITLDPRVLLTAVVGLILGVIMLKMNGLTGMGLLGQLGMIVGSTIGGILVGFWIFRE